MGPVDWFLGTHFEWNKTSSGGLSIFLSQQAFAQNWLSIIVSTKPPIFQIAHPIIQVLRLTPFCQKRSMTMTPHIFLVTNHIKVLPAASISLLVIHNLMFHRLILSLYRITVIQSMVTYRWPFISFKTFTVLILTGFNYWGPRRRSRQLLEIEEDTVRPLP